MRKFTFSALLSVFVFSSLFGQDRFYNTYGDFNALANEALYSKSVDYTLLDDGTSLIAGIEIYISPNIFALGLKKLNQNGTVIWSKIIDLGTTFNTHDSGRFQVADILEDQDGYVIALNKVVYDAGGVFPTESISYLLKISTNGANVIWANTLTEFGGAIKGSRGHLQLNQLSFGKDGYAFIGTLDLFTMQPGPGNPNTNNKVVYGEVNFNDGQLAWNKVIALAGVGLQGLSIYYQAATDHHYIYIRPVKLNCFSKLATIVKAIPDGPLVWVKHFDRIFALAEPFGEASIIDNHPLNPNGSQLAIVGQTMGQTDFVVAPFNENGEAVSPVVRFSLPGSANITQSIKSAKILANGRIACLLGDDNVGQYNFVVGKLTGSNFPAEQYNLNSPLNVDENTFFRSLGIINNQVNIGGHLIIPALTTPQVLNTYSIIQSDDATNFTSCLAKESFNGEEFPGDGGSLQTIDLLVQTPILDIYANATQEFGIPVDKSYVKDALCEECITTNASFEITAAPEPNVCSYTISSTSSFDCLNEAVYEWAVRDNSTGAVYDNFANTNEITFEPGCNGSFRVCLQITDCPDCTSRSCEVFTIDCANVPCSFAPDDEAIFAAPEDGNQIALSPQIFPNPSNDLIHIKIGVFKDHQSTIYLKDNNGKLVKTFKPSLGTDLFSMDMSRQAIGMYFIIIEANGIRYPAKKVVITK